MSMEDQRDYAAEAKALKHKRGLSDRELSKIASREKYNNNNKVFIKRKGKIKNDTTKLKLEAFNYIMQLQLIPSENFTDILNNYVTDIAELDKRMRLLKMQKAEERYTFKKTK